MKNNSIPTKHVYAGTTRIVSKRLAGGNATNAPGNWNDTKRNNGKGQGNNPAPAATANTGTATGTAAANAVATDTPTGPGNSQGLNNRSARANDVAQNTNKNPNLTTGHPGQGINNRSDRANERAQNTVKNPNLNGVAVPPGGGNGNNNGNNGNNAWQPEQHFLYYYHPDHLGSTSYVTDTNGKLYEHIQYFPFGETWVQQAHNTERTPYQYTVKELDEETGLYYYGARYYDPRTSVWQSADPVLGKYLPTGNREQDARLPGLGGVFTTPNLGLYTYTHQNPVRLIDPDGREVIDGSMTVSEAQQELSNRWSGESMSGGAGFLDYMFDEDTLSLPAGAAAKGVATTAVKGNWASRAGAWLRNVFFRSKGYPKPNVKDPNLQNLVNDLYKGAKTKKPIGTGSTADAIRHEAITKKPVGGKFHREKGEQYSNALGKWLRKNPNASASDRRAAQNMLDDLKDALKGKE